MGGYSSRKYDSLTAIARVGAMLLALLALCATDAASAKSRLTEFTARVSPQDVFPGATRFGDPQGDPPIVPVFAADQLQGYVYLNSDFAVATGYSGKPVNMLVGIDATGVVRGIKLVEHKEPIVLVGVPEARVVAAINKLIGLKIAPVAAGKARAPQPDIVSGATVTILVMADSVVRSAVRLWRSGRLSPAGAGAAPGPAAEAEKVINDEKRMSRIGPLSSSRERSPACISPFPTSTARSNVLATRRRRPIRSREDRTTLSSTFTCRWSACLPSGKASWERRATSS